MTEERIRKEFSTMEIPDMKPEILEKLDGMGLVDGILARRLAA